MGRGLSHRPPPEAAGARPDLRAWAAAAADTPDWLFEESYAQAGDLAETITLLVPRGTRRAMTHSLPSGCRSDCSRSRRWSADSSARMLLEAWRALDGTARFVFNKLLTGAFRVGVSDGLVVRALAATSGVDADVIAHRLMGRWEPDAAWFTALTCAETADADWSRPYPFFLAHRARHGAVDATRRRADVAGGMEVGWHSGAGREATRPRTALESRRGAAHGPLSRGGAGMCAAPQRHGARWRAAGLARRHPDAVHRAAAPSESQDGGQDAARRPCRCTSWRTTASSTRASMCARSRCTSVAPISRWSCRRCPTGAPVSVSPRWRPPPGRRSRPRATSRTREAEGLMLKRANSPYGVGRRGGDWRKWKVSPLTVDAVLVYAQAGHGRRAGLLHRLHVCRVGRRDARAVREGLLRAHRRRDS
jgi:DNA ligase 1